MTWLEDLITRDDDTLNIDFQNESGGASKGRYQGLRVLDLTQLGPSSIRMTPYARHDVPTFGKGLGKSGDKGIFIGEMGRDSRTRKGSKSAGLSKAKGKNEAISRDEARFPTGKGPTDRVGRDRAIVNSRRVNHSPSPKRDP